MLKTSRKTVFAGLVAAIFSFISCQTSEQEIISPVEVYQINGKEMRVLSYTSSSKLSETAIVEYNGKTIEYTKHIDSIVLSGDINVVIPTQKDGTPDFKSHRQQLLGSLKCARPKMANLCVAGAAAAAIACVAGTSLVGGAFCMIAYGSAIAICQDTYCEPIM